MAYDNDSAADEVVRREAALRGMTETLYRMLRAANTSVVQDHCRGSRWEAGCHATSITGLTDRPRRARTWHWLGRAKAVHQTTGNRLDRRDGGTPDGQGTC